MSYVKKPKATNIAALNISWETVSEPMVMSAALNDYFGTIGSQHYVFYNNRFFATIGFLQQYVLAKSIMNTNQCNDMEPSNHSMYFFNVHAQI